MKISILNFDLSNNSLGRAHLLAKMLSRKYTVEILGPAYQDKIWAPVASENEITYIVLNKSLKKIKSNLMKIDGDIIYAIKPKGTSYGYALLKKFINKKKVILDEDDWDLAFLLDLPKKEIYNNAKNIFDINNITYTFILSNLTFLADAVTVSSTFLRNKFGGTIIPHARDPKTFVFDEKKASIISKKYNPDNRKIIMFSGTIRKHKGIDIIIKALDLVKRNEILFIILGVDENSKDEIPYREYIRTIPPQKFKDLPNYLQMADLVILPQKKSRSAQGQMPAKLYDAMAMSKPIIASKISDIPLVLKNCGLVFEPEDYIDLSKKIAYVFDNPKIASDMGVKARSKFINEYSYEAVSKELLKIFDKFEKRL